VLMSRRLCRRPGWRRHGAGISRIGSRTLPWLRCSPD
jgi:hypothetical protein